jgi:hypothetical protein
VPHTGSRTKSDATFGQVYEQAAGSGPRRPAHRLPSNQPPEGARDDELQAPVKARTVVSITNRLRRQSPAAAGLQDCFNARCAACASDCWIAIPEHLLPRRLGCALQVLLAKALTMPTFEEASCVYLDSSLSERFEELERLCPAIRSVVVADAEVVMITLTSVVARAERLVVPFEKIRVVVAVVGVEVENRETAARGLRRSSARRSATDLRAVTCVSSRALEPRPRADAGAYRGLRGAAGAARRAVCCEPMTQPAKQTTSERRRFRRLWRQSSCSKSFPALGGSALSVC